MGKYYQRLFILLCFGGGLLWLTGYKERKLIPSSSVVLGDVDTSNQDRWRKEFIRKLQRLSNEDTLWNTKTENSSTDDYPDYSDWNPQKRSRMNSNDNVDWVPHNRDMDKHQKGITDSKGQDQWEPESNKNKRMELNVTERILQFDMLQIIHQYKQKGHADEKPIHTFDFGYRIHPKALCSGKDDIYVLFVVKSCPKNQERRNAIRKTWGNSNRFRRIRTVFSLGIPKKYKIENLYEESTVHNDILLVNYMDDYFNLTLKTVSGLKWTVNHCSRAAFVVSIDDDIYTAPDLLFKYLKKLPLHRKHKLYAGYKYLNRKPERETGHKWTVSEEEYPYDIYPPYIFGGFIIMSMTTVEEFSIAAMYTELFKFEDVFLGILAKRIGINVTANGQVSVGYQITSKDKFFKSVIASHYYGNPVDLRRNWQCHVYFLDRADENMVFCEYIRLLFKEIQSNMNEIKKWREK